MQLSGIRFFPWFLATIFSDLFLLAQLLIKVVVAFVNEHVLVEFKPSLKKLLEFKLNIMHS